MRKLTFILAALIAFGHLNAQDKKVAKIEFEGLKRTKEVFLKRLIKTKEGATYDSLLVVKDVERLNRLTGIAKATATVTEQNGETIVNYSIDENFTIIPGPRISTASDGRFCLPTFTLRI